MIINVDLILELGGDEGGFEANVSIGRILEPEVVVLGSGGGSGCRCCYDIGTGRW